MLRKGFVEVQIEMLAKALAVVFGYRNRGDNEGALAAIRQASWKVSGLDIGLLASLTPESLLAQFADASGFDAGRCAAAGCLLHEQALIMTDEAQSERAADMSAKALTLLLSAGHHNDAARTPDVRERVGALLETIEYQDLAPADQRLLVEHFEACGSFADAEDVLFALREHGQPEWRSEAQSFYERLRVRTDAELEAGGLSREEVEEGLAEVG